MKKTAAYLALPALAVAALVYLSPTRPPKWAALAGQEWREHVSEDGSYSVSMPGEPVLSVREQESALGGKVSIRSAIVERPADRAHFVAFHHRLPDGVKTDDTDSLLDSMASSYVRQTRTRLIASRRVRLDGNPGRALLLFSPTTGEINRQIVRFFVTNTHAYFAIVATNDEQEGQPFVTRSLDSLRPLK